MKKELLITSSIVGVLASIVCLFFKWQYAISVLMGLAFSFLYFYLLTSSFKINENGEISKGSFIGWLLRIIVLAIPLLISCLLPNVFNIFATFGGIMIFRVVMMIFFYRQKGSV